VRACRKTGGPEQANDLPWRNRLTSGDPKRREVAIQDTDVRVDRNDDEVAGSGRVEARERYPVGRRMHLGPFPSREVDPSVDVVPGTERVEWFQVQGAAAEGLGDGGSYDDAAHRKPDMGRHLRRGHEPDRDRQRGEGEKTHLSLRQRVPDVDERCMDDRLELVGRLFRPAHRSRHLENDQQRGEREQMVDRAHAVVLQRKADRQDK